MLLVAPNASVLANRRKEFQKGMKEVLTVKHEQRATSHKIAFSLEQVKQEALTLREKISSELSAVEEKCDVSGMGELDQADKEALSRRTREILHQCYKFGFEYHKELDRLVTGQKSRASLSRGVIAFAKQWMTFVRNRCDRGKGVKPRWATHGIDFLYMASSPAYTKHVDNDEFSEFKAMIEDCYGHIIGDESNVESPSSHKDRRSYSRSSSRSRPTSRPTSPAGGGRPRTPKTTSTVVGVDLSPKNPHEEHLAKLQMPPPNSPNV